MRVSDPPVPTPAHVVLEDRVIGRVGPLDRGPIVVAVAGIHGNEPAGVRALERVHRHLQTVQSDLQGEVVCLRGNLRGLWAKRRFLERDLNRMWTEERVRRLEEAHDRGGTLPAGDELARDRAEWKELRELHAELAPYLRRASRERPLHLLDLHTASAASVPFGLIGDTLRNRGFVRGLAIPILLGLEERLEGSLLEAIGGRGHLTLGVEGGQHDDPAAIDCIESAVWVALENANVLDSGEESRRKVARSRRYLTTIAHDQPGLLEVRYRHGLRSGDGFAMHPGYTNFARVERGQPLGRDVRGEVNSPQDARILLPLYQGLGDDGFFLGRPISWHQDALLLLARRIGLDRFLGLWPGLHRVRDGRAVGFADHEVLVAEPGVDSFLRDELLPSLGYRRARRQDGRWWFARRPEWPREDR
ncbi:MAG: succinylglutamate desuccinylase/aspartoacylase family protein [Planctomycetes bacterium]|nr:succinylglutamate desuccinylase/aspartoacylase family protein [Planctomycetota bacterium]